MKVEDLIGYIYEEVHIYKEKSDFDINEPFEDIYIGLVENTPSGIKNMRVASIGVSSKGYLDIKVK